MGSGFPLWDLISVLITCNLFTKVEQHLAQQDVIHTSLQPYYTIPPLAAAKGNTSADLLSISSSRRTPLPPALSFGLPIYPSGIRFLGKVYLLNL
jgi:hypothetical protein